jgi:CheY-like chemotaxis protein
MSKSTCLIVDDDPDDREIFAMALESIGGMDCESASNGMQALDLLKSGAVPSFIFLDLNMPLMSGRDCLIEMNRLPQLKHVPIIIYSTSSEIRDIKETKELGAFDYITKPTSLKELVNILTDIFKKTHISSYRNGKV